MSPHSEHAPQPSPSPLPKRIIEGNQPDIQPIIYQGIKQDIHTYIKSDILQNIQINILLDTQAHNLNKQGYNNTSIDAAINQSNHSTKHPADNQLNMQGYNITTIDSAINPSHPIRQPADNQTYNDYNSRHKQTVQLLATKINQPEHQLQMFLNFTQSLDELTLDYSSHRQTPCVYLHNWTVVLESQWESTSHEAIPIWRPQLLRADGFAIKVYS